MKPCGKNYRLVSVGLFFFLIVFWVLFPRILSYADNGDADDQTSVVSDSSIQKMNPAGDELFWYSCLKVGFGRYDNLTKAGPPSPVEFKAWSTGLLYAELGLGYRIIYIGSYGMVIKQPIGTAIEDGCSHSARQYTLGFKLKLRILPHRLQVNIWPTVGFIYEDEKVGIYPVEGKDKTPLLDEQRWDRGLSYGLEGACQLSRLLSLQFGYTHDDLQIRADHYSIEFGLGFISNAFITPEESKELRALGLFGGFGFEWIRKSDSRTDWLIYLTLKGSLLF